jgi:hypothetical protein
VVKIEEKRSTLSSPKANKILEGDGGVEGEAGESLEECQIISRE